MKRSRMFVGALAVAACLAACSQVPGSSPTATELVAQRLGTSADDAVVSSSLDTQRGAIVTLGTTEGALSGTSQGQRDVFLQRYDRSGKVVWTRQFGGNSDDSAGGVAVDGSGSVYAGYTLGSATAADVGKLEKRRSDGTLIWSRTVQISTDEPSYLTALTADAAGNVYAAGATSSSGESLFVRKYSAAGSLVWSKVIEGYGLFFFPTAAGTDSSGNLYVTANVVDDSFIDNRILKYSPSGTKVFDKTIDVGGSDLSLNALQVRGSALYLAGTLHYNWIGDPDQQSEEDAYIAKYTLSGASSWRSSFGTRVRDEANGVTADENGNVYVTGFTEGNLGGVTPGGSDIFLRKYSASGAALWTKQIGSTGEDAGNAVAAYSASELYLAGQAGGPLLGSTHRGGTDGFLRRVDGAGNRIWTDQ